MKDGHLIDDGITDADEIRRLQDEEMDRIEQRLKKSNGKVLRVEQHGEVLVEQPIDGGLDFFCEIKQLGILISVRRPAQEDSKG